MQLAGLPADALLELRLPAEAANLDYGALVDMAFPADEEGRALIQESLDLLDNPDLPEIYESFLLVADQSRAGLCRLDVRELSRALLPADDATESYPPLVPGLEAGGLCLLLTPVYNALEYASGQGYDAGEADLLGWLQLCAVVYFLDKHEVTLPDPDSLADGSGLRPAVERVLDLGLAVPSATGEGADITAEGRRFIGRLLAETESYIDRYDIFQDVVWDDDSGQALFGTGLGDDLRVEAYVADNVDPVRAVFLLRLYDGTLDEFAGDWADRVCDPDFYNRVLEPVVDRTVTPADLLDEILEQGLSWLEESRRRQEERAANVRIAGRLSELPEDSRE